MNNKIKKIFYAIWILLVVSLVIASLVKPEILKPSYIRDFIKSYNNEMLLIYIALTFLRGFFLVPSTPFVIAGGMLFPDKLFLILLISMIGIVLSATSLYYFSDLLGFSKYLEKKYPNEVITWKRRLKDPKAILFVIGWAFLPVVPTDLICYVAGIVKMPYKHMIAGVFLGEIILVSFYIFYVSQLI